MPVATPSRAADSEAPKAIGSVFPSAVEEVSDPADGLWRLWTDRFAHSAAFQTARGAVHALLSAQGVRRLWLPAYVCDATMQAAPRGCEVAFYRHGPGLPVADLDPQPGDAVLGVDYFGRSDPAMAALAARAPEILWVEDRAQALDPNRPPWGDVVLYSPRKLIGVGDGGLMVSNRPLPQPTSPAPQGDCLQAPHLARSADRLAQAPQTWVPAFQAREAAFDSRPIAMHPETRARLGSVAARPLAARRRSNAAVLMGLLPDLALWNEGIDFAPLAFPVRVADAGAAVEALAAERIFCPRHWADLPSPAMAFADAHRLSRELVSLPCDQRYDADDMTRVAETVRRLCKPAEGSR